jgi:hypothetical protein
MSTHMSSTDPDGPDFGDELFHSAEQAAVPSPAEPPRRRPWRRRLVAALLLVGTAGGAMFAVQQHDPERVQDWLDQIQASIRPAETAPEKAEVVPVADTPQPRQESLALWTKALQDAQQQGRDSLAQQQTDFLAATQKMKADFDQATQAMERKLADADKQSTADRQALRQLRVQLDEVRAQAKNAAKEAARFESETLAKQKEVEPFQKQLAEAQKQLADTQELARKTQAELLEERDRTADLRKQVETLAQQAKATVPVESPKSSASLSVDPKGAEAAIEPIKTTPQKQSWTGRLTERSGGSGTPSIVHTTMLRQGVRYVIDLKSSEFDPILRLEDAQGRLILEDDDGGGGLNSRISYTATRTGVHRLVVTRYGGVGEYQLTVREP